MSLVADHAEIVFGAIRVDDLCRVLRRPAAARSRVAASRFEGTLLYVDRAQQLRTVATDGRWVLQDIAPNPFSGPAAQEDIVAVLPSSFTDLVLAEYGPDAVVEVGVRWADGFPEVLVGRPDEERLLAQTAWAPKTHTDRWSEIENAVAGDGATFVAVPTAGLMTALVQAGPGESVTVAVAPDRVFVRTATGPVGEPIPASVDGPPRMVTLPADVLLDAVRFVCWTGTGRYDHVGLTIGPDGAAAQLWGKRVTTDGSTEDGAPDCWLDVDALRTRPPGGDRVPWPGTEDPAPAAELTDISPGGPDDAELDAPVSEDDPAAPAEAGHDVDGPLAELDAIVGQPALKRQVKELVAQAELVRRRRALGVSAELSAAHLLFTGPPGTGKTTVARLIAKLYHALGFLPTDHVVEVDRSALVAAHIGGTEERTAAAIEDAIGGVLFVDEAYTLVNGSENDFGRQALDTLLKALEDRRGEFVCIVAGYPDEMRDFVEANPGIASRFTRTVDFERYTADDLVAIAERMAEDSGAAFAPEALDVLRSRLHEAEVGGVFADRSWGNARAARTLVERAAAARDVRLNATGLDGLDRRALVEIASDDVVEACDHQGIGRPSGPADDVEQVLEELRAQVGQEQLKRQIEVMVANARAARARSAGGEVVRADLPHLLFTGPPGTGKTTVARLLARLYRALGLLPSGHVVEVDSTDLVAGYIGQTAIKTDQRIQEAMGGVLFVDEAYTLAGDRERHFGHEAVSTLLKRMEDHRGRFLVIAAGYPDQMVEFLRMNPGLARRFPTTIAFEAYSADELALIAESMAVQRGQHLAEDAAALLRERLLDAERNGAFARPDWGNAGSIRNLVEEAARIRDTRVFADPDHEPTAAELEELGVADVAAACASVLATESTPRESVEDVLAELAEQVGQPAVKQQVASLMAGVRAQQVRARQGIGSGGSLIEHLVFTGPPGTGKTTIARLLARLYRALGVLPTGQVVEVDAAGLVAGHVGQTALKTEERIQEAMGGVLFVDEAYTLVGDRDRSFGQEAIDTLLARMENDRGKFMVVVAGYPDEMRGFIRSNPGLPSRFTQTIAFDVYRAPELVAIAESMASAAHERFTDDARSVLADRLAAAEAAGRFAEREWGNGRSVRNLVDDARRARDLRLFADPASDPLPDEVVTLTAVDVDAAADAAGLPPVVGPEVSPPR